ncbi:uncharacterized protein LOC141692016 [Apium graveolens]|uniref:uncharacterized protein LOC141692016 n=1 Tax=Apium graveolens TaxID=4045 RepID=UPI003D78F27B
MAASGRITYQEMLNHLFLHPSDNATSIQVEKLQGSADFRSWSRSMEINLASKRKLGFVNGTITRSTDDEAKAEMWDVCNNMVIAWLTSNVSPSIKRSIMYMTNASDIWKNLETRFALTDGSRKYKISKDLYEVKQHSSSVNEYYTTMRTLWEELDNMNLLPVVANPSDEIQKLLATIELQKEEARLFQFLNGLDDSYSSIRSQLLMYNPLPTVEMASATLQQEEAQRDLLQGSKSEHELMAMYSKNNTEHKERSVICSACKVRGHTSERCWTVIGYPRWHPKHKPNFAANRINTNPTTRWSSNRVQTPRMAATVQSSQNSNGIFFHSTTVGAIGTINATDATFTG